LSDIEKLEIDGVELLHSTPEALFSDGIKIDGEVKTSLVTCMPGCYTSMARVKGGFRRVENMFYATEKMLAAASLIGLSVNPDGMKKAERHLLLTTFHDIIPGTVIEDAEGEALATLGAAERILLDYRTRAFLYLTMNERCAGEGEYPVFVFNYAPYEVNTLVEAEFSLADQNWENCIFSPHVYDECGRELPSQTIKERSTLNLDWRKRIIFKATLSPLGITRFTVKCTPVPVFDKKATRVGALTEFFGKSTVIEAPCALEMYDDTADPWGMSREELLAVGKNPTPFREMSEKESARYLGYEGELSPLRIVEDGDIYTMLEGFYTEGATNAALKYRLYKNEPYIDVQATVEYADKNKLVRIKVPIPADMSGALPVGDGPFVWESKPNVGEVCFQKWLGVKRDDEVFAVINNGIYGGKVEDGFIHLTLLRGAGYCIHPIQERELYPHDRYLPRIESGRYTFNFRIIRGTLAKVFAAAEEFNQPPYAVNVFPTGGGSSAASARINVTGDVCVPTVNKRDDGSYLIRLYNPSEQASSATVSFGDVSCEVELSAAEVATAILCDGKFNVYHETLPV